MARIIDRDTLNALRDNEWPERFLLAALLVYVGVPVLLVAWMFGYVGNEKRRGSDV